MVRLFHTSEFAFIDMGSVIAIWLICLSIHYLAVTGLCIACGKHRAVCYPGHHHAGIAANKVVFRNVMTLFKLNSGIRPHEKGNNAGIFFELLTPYHHSILRLDSGLANAEIYLTFTA